MDNGITVGDGGSWKSSYDKLCWVTQAEAVEAQRKRQVKWVTGKTFTKQMMTKKIRGESLV